MAESVIEVDRVSKSYQRGFFRSRKKVLDDVSFRIPRGSVFGFLGHNGAGKSTTIKALLNFVRIDRGRIRVLGADPSSSAIRRRIGFLPETADYYPFLTPHRLLLLYSDIFGISREDANRRIERLLGLVGLQREKNERIGSFSKGMKQRVGIAQALLNDPELLILDEPASGLDPLGQREIRDLIADQKKLGRTIFFSSHELSEVEAVCDEAAIIQFGRIVRQGTLSELVPYREGIIVRVRANDPERLLQQSFVKEIHDSSRPGEIAFLAQSGMSFDEAARAAREAGYEILSISAIRDSLESVFLRLMNEEGK